MIQINGSTVSKSGDSIPVMFKVYPGGKLTNVILSDKLKKLQISFPKGEGLKLGQIQPGKIIIIAGGTGLFPFSDLIDLLFKEQLMRINPSTVKEILKLNPILQGDPLSCYQF